MTTQGFDDGWVIKYKLLYRHYSGLFLRTTGRSNKLLIDANFDADTPVTQMLRDPTRGNALKLYPVEWHNVIKLRWKVHGCDSKYRKYCIFLYTESF